MTVILISKAIIMGVIILVLVAVAAPFFLAGLEWIWDSWRGNR